MRHRKAHVGSGDDDAAGMVVNVPDGLQSRPNGERFAWETDPVALANAAASAALATPTPTPSTALIAVSPAAGSPAAASPEADFAATTGATLATPTLSVAAAPAAVCKN